MKVNIALLTVTDTRTIDNDKSGGILVNKIKEADHNLIDRKICKDDKDEIVLILKDWLNNEKIADFSDKTKEEVKYIRSFLSMKMYNHDKVKAMTSNAHQIISSLFKLFIEQDEKFIKEHMKKIISDKDKPRAVCDFIAGMTDNYAQNFYNKFN